MDSPVVALAAKPSTNDCKYTNLQSSGASYRSPNYLLIILIVINLILSIVLHMTGSMPILNVFEVNISSCDVNDNRCLSNMNSSICCFLYVVVAVARYIDTHKVVVFMYPENGMDMQKIAKLLSEQFMENRIFSLDQRLSNEALLGASDTNLFFVWWRLNRPNNTNSVQLLNRMIELNLLQRPRVLYIVTDDNEEPRTLLKSVNLTPVSLVAVIQKNSNQNATGYLVSDVYGADEHHTLVTRVFASLWIHGNVVRYKKTGVFPEKIRKLLNYTIRVGALRRPPFTDYYPETDELSGILGDILKTSQKLLSLSYDTHLSGEDNATRTLDIFEELRLNKSDLILGVHTMGRRRRILYSFSRPVAFGQYLIVYQRPELTRFASGYVAAFSNGLWTIVLITFLMFNIIIIVTNKILKIFSSKDTNIENQAEDVRHLKSTIFNTIAAFALRGDAYLRQSQSSQIVWFTFCVFSFLIFSSFSSKLTSFFTVYTEKIPFKSMNDLIDNTNFSVTAIINSSAYKRIEKATSGVHVKVKHRIAKYVESSKAGVEYVYTHSDAILYDHNVQVCPHLRDNCSFATILASMFYKHSFHFVFTKNHSLMHDFNKVIGMFEETGVLSKMREPVQWISEVYCAQKNEYDSLTINEIFPLIYILALGLTMSVFAFIVERWVY